MRISQTHPEFRRAGFTLLEVLVVSVIALIIFGVGMMAIAGTIKARSESLARIRATENARLLFQQLDRDLAGAYPMFTVNTKAGMRTTYTLPTSGFSTDAIQFYTRIDRRDALDDYVLVRYYVNDRQELCRQVQVFSNTGVNDISPLLSPQGLQVESNAVFDTVHSMIVYYRWFNPDTKQYLPLLSSIGDTPPPGQTIETASHLQIKLRMFDTSGQPNRTFVNVFPIPTTFNR